MTMYLSPSMEDYLEAIFELDKHKRVVRVKDVAEKLSVTMPSVNGALKNLESQGLVKHEKYDYIELTKTGERQASKISSKHHVICTFLKEFLGVDSDTAEQDACRIEHVLSAVTMEKLMEFVEEKSLKKLVKNQSFSNDKMKYGRKTVNDLLPGEYGIIREIHAMDNIKQRLIDMGILEGVQVEMVRSAPLDDPIQIKVLNTQIAIRRSEARTLVINTHGKGHYGRHLHRHRFGR